MRRVTVVSEMELHRELDLPLAPCSYKSLATRYRALEAFAAVRSET